MKLKSIPLLLLGAAVLAALLALTAGCRSETGTETVRDKAHAAILAYLETQGQAKAIACIDQLAAAGKLGSANAEKLKAAVPLGIEKLREVMGKMEREDAE